VIPSLAILTYVCTKYQLGNGPIRTFGIAAVLVLLLVALLSAASNIIVVRCTDDPSQFCEYNDSVPFMATIVAIYVIVTGFRTRHLWVYR